MSRLLAPAAVVTLLLAGWELYVTISAIGPEVLPAPSAVALATWENRADLVENGLATLRAATLGFALAIAVGFVCSVAIDASAVVRRALLPLLIASQTLPIIAVAPLAVIWFGFGLLPKVLLVALVTFFPITVAFVEGYAATEPEASSLLRSMGAGRWRQFVLLRLPTALPFFFAGLRIDVTYAIVAAIFAEYAGASEGLGIYMQTAKNSFRTDLVLAAVLVSALLTVALFALTYVLQRATIPWYDQRRAERS